MKNNTHRKLTQLLGLLVFALFAVCVAAVLLSGVKSYQTLTRRGAMAHEQRVAVRYLTTRFRQAPSVRVEDFCGLQTLTIREEIQGKTYLTRVYCYEGSIRELFSGESAKVTPKDGEEVLAAQELSFSQEGRQLAVEIVHPDGATHTLVLALPEWKEDTP